MSPEAVLSLTTRTRVALAIARGIAAARGDDDLTPTHIALGLLRERENIAVAILHEAGANLRTLRHELEAELGSCGRPRTAEVAIPATHGEKRVLALAAAESRSRSHPYLGAEHLLFAILHDDTSPTAMLFARHGMDLDCAAACWQSMQSRAANRSAPES
jgi:ATP-dependent Clp protease ATP-binding subunit ClpC